MRIATVAGARSGLINLDLDTKSGRNGAGEAGSHPRGAARHTDRKIPSGGVHVFFSMPKGINLYNRAGDIAPGIDTRASRADGSHGGVIPLPPSPGPNGGCYEFQEGWQYLFDLRQLPEPPPWLLFRWIFNASHRERLAALGINGHESFDGVPATEWESIGREKLRGALRAAHGASPDGPLPDEMANRLRKYLQNAIAGELQKITDAVQGSRDRAINDAALKTWSLLHGAAEWMDTAELVSETRRRFLEAATTLGDDEKAGPFVDIAAEKWDRVCDAAEARDLNHIVLGTTAADDFADVDAADGDATEPAKRIPVSHDGLALCFSARHEHDLRYVHLWGQWLLWDGKRWRPEETLRAFDLARALAREEAAKHKRAQAREIASAGTVAAIERLARSDRRHASSSDAWDKDPWLLCTPNGTVDLRTGAMREHRREDLISKTTAVGPNGDCPLWLAFLDQIFKSDQELIALVQRMLGYTLTGSTESMHCSSATAWAGMGRGCC
jgi:D5 N terminal like/Bifunctional DNA primase/polymerase, N-terminal